MWAYIVVSVIMAAIGSIQLPDQFRQRRIREIIVFAVYLASGGVLSVIAIQLYTIRSPLDIIVWIYTPVNQLLAALFQ